MTSPSNPIVTPVQEQLAAERQEQVVATAKKLVRVRSFAKSAFTKVGVPAIIGAATGLAVTRAARRAQESDDLESDTVSDSNE